MIKLQGYEVSSLDNLQPIISSYELLSYSFMFDSTQTRELIDDLRSASASDRSKLGADTKTLLRILCHRSDNEASQFLKKQYKIPKSAA